MVASNCRSGRGLCKAIFRLPKLRIVYVVASAVSLLLYFLSAVLPAFAKGLIFIGIARVLHRIVPIIEESKTLV